jgi:hypothetical protein
LLASLADQQRAGPIHPLAQDACKPLALTP